MARDPIIKGENAMTYPQNRWARTLLVVVILMGGVFSVVSPARAQGIQVTFDDSIASGEVVNNDAVLAGNSVNIDGKVEGDALAVGTSVEINGDVTGSLIAIGQNVVINGTVEGTVYVAAVTLDLGSESSLSRNLYFIGASIATDQKSTIDRDLVLVSMGAQLAGDIGRNTVGVIGPWELFTLFMEKIGRPVFEPQSGLGASGTVYRVQSQPVVLSSFLPSMNSISAIQPAVKLPPASVTEPGLAAQSSSGIDSEQVQRWLQRAFQEFVTLLVFGLLGIWLFSSFLKRSAGKAETKPLQSTGFGLLGLVISIALIGVVILVALLILMLGIGLGALNFWDLAVAVWGVGFTSLGLAFWLSLLFVSYGTKVIVAFLVGTLILRRVAPQSMKYKILPLLLGLLIYVLLVWIPYIGWVIAVLVNAVGLGAAWLAYREKGLEEMEEPASAEEAESE
jgi:cytoskeletal protein CcmA (bactofilin family)